MPIGGGILPASGSNQYTELTYVTAGTGTGTAGTGTATGYIHYFVIDPYTGQQNV